MNSDMPYFIKSIIISKWDYKLSQEETQNQVHNVISLIQYISLTCGSENYDSYTLHIEAKCILDSFLFLSKNEVEKTLTALVEVLERLHHRSLTVSLSLGDLHLNILNDNAFAAVLTIAISNLLRRFMKNASNELMLLRIIRCILTSLNSLITSPTSIHLLMTLHLLVKNCTNLSNCQHLLLNQMYLYLKGIHGRQAIKISDEILGICIKRMSMQDKIVLFQKINKSLWWDRGECVIIIHLLNNWPIHMNIDNFLCEMAPRLAAMLLENITDYAMKVLRVAINHMDFETWNLVFIPNIINMILTYLDNDWELIARTMSQCVNLGVQRFEYRIYTEIRPNLLFTCYPALALYYSINKGCLNIMDYKQYIHNLIHSPDHISRNYGVKAICVFNNKKSELSSWHIDHMKFYLENTFFSPEDVCFKDLNYFLSHMNVQANRILYINDSLDNLDCYTEFIQWLYEFSLLGLLSRSLKGVKVGSELFHLVWRTVSDNSQGLRTKYNLDESDCYDQKQSAFYKYLQTRGAWQYESDDTYQVIVQEFLSSEKVFPEVFTIIEKWNIIPSNFIPEIAFDVLENKYGKEFVAKAELCITLALRQQNTDDKIAEVLEKWKHLVERFSSCLAVDIKELLIVYSFTSCIATLLHKGLIKKVEYATILMCCSCLTRKLVKISFDHSHALKSIEQTLVSVMNILCVILRSSEEKPFDACFELVSEVIDHGSGKSVACAAASAIQAICSNAFAYSNDVQAILNQYFESVLFSIYATPEIRTSKIRRNPEHRLIINAIVTAETHQNRVFLNRSMRFILDVLENPLSANSAKASALHTLEILISNSGIQNETHSYVSSAATQAIDEFSNSDWNVKNGAIQVLQALINRLLGQRNNLTQRRRHSMDDLLVLYPNLMIHCHKLVHSPITQNNCDSVIAVLALFSESFYTPYNIHNDHTTSSIVQSFQNAFINLILTNSNVGIFAAKAYAALYPLTNIPTAICDIVTWIKDNFDFISKKVFATIINLLVAILNKFNTFFVDEDNVELVNSYLLDLKIFLKRYNCKYEFSLFNILAIVTYDVVELKDKIVVILKESETYETRLWLNTNFPYVLNNIGVDDYPSFLNCCLKFDLSITLLRHSIESVINRYKELEENSLINSVLDVFVNKFVQLESMSYISISFCEIILLLVEGSQCYSCSRNMILRLREKCVNTFNIYSLAVYLALLSNCVDYVEEDDLFLHKAVKLYTHHVARRESEMQTFVASTLIFLYNSITVSQRSNILKLSFILLLTPESSSEVCKFLAFLFKQNLSNTYETLLSLLSAQNLLNYLQSKMEVEKFLNKLKQFVNTLGDEFEDCGMFYMKQNDHICSYKTKLISILEKQIGVVAKIR